MSSFTRLFLFLCLFLPMAGGYAQASKEQTTESVSATGDQIDAMLVEGEASASILVREAVNAAASAKIDAAKAQSRAAEKEAEAEKKKADKLVPLSEIGNRYISRNMVYPVYQKHDRKTAFCLPSRTYFRIGEKQNDGYIAITIESYPTVNKVGMAYKNHPKHGSNGLELECKPIKVDGSEDSVRWANSEISHVIQADALAAADFKRSGATFGVLAVPFKYYLGNEKKLAVSTTVAPYLGFSFEGKAAIRFVPFVSAGLGLTPVEDAATNKVETKPALSAAVGLLIASAKNPNWSTGLVLGKDFLGKAESAGDNTVGDGWISIFVGTTLK